MAQFKPCFTSLGLNTAALAAPRALSVAWELIKMSQEDYDKSGARITLQEVTAGPGGRLPFSNGDGTSMQRSSTAWWQGQGAWGAAPSWV